MPSIAAVEETRSVEVFSLDVVHLRDGERPSVVGITVYSDGFRGVDFERRLNIKPSTIPDDMSRIVRALTDRWMPGFERY